MGIIAYGIRFASFDGWYLAGVQLRMSATNDDVTRRREPAAIGPSQVVLESGSDLYRGVHLYMYYSTYINQST